MAAAITLPAVVTLGPETTPQSPSLAAGPSKTVVRAAPLPPPPASRAPRSHAAGHRAPARRALGAHAAAPRASAPRVLGAAPAVFHPRSASVPPASVVTATTNRERPVH